MTDIDEAKVISDLFSRGTDRRTDKQTGFRNPHMETCRQSAHKKKLDVDPQRDDDAPPMSTYRCMLRPT